MAEIERLEREEEQERARRGILIEQTDQRSVAMEEVDKANPLELIFVPDDWMQE